MKEETKKSARKKMRPFCRVCPRCDGKICAGEVPGMGGTGTGSSFIRNVEALEKYRLRMKVLHNLTETETSTSLFGRPLSAPIISAPVGGVAFNMSSYIGEKEYIRALVEGAVAAECMASTGDGELDEIFDSSMEVLSSDGLVGIPFIKPWDHKTVKEKIKRIEETTAPALGMDIDAAGLITLSEVGRSVYPKPPEEIERIVGTTSLPFIIKGIMTREEARGAVDAGASAIVVSNHGGRVLDFTPATSEVLPGIAEEVGGECSILIDGGIRSGADVFKILALGADAILIGRPFSIAAIGAGSSGVYNEFEKIKAELHHTMLMTGVSKLSEITDDSLVTD